MSWTLTISGAAIAKAGLNANSSVIMDSVILDKWSDMAEATLSTITRYDWVTNYANVKTTFKQVLSDAVSDMIAMKIINYDMSGYSSRAEAETMLDVLRDNVVRNIEVLKEEENKEKMF